MADQRTQADLDRRRSNASQPIPAGQRKRSRSWEKQQLKEQHR